jgi:cation-transporting P-type ATPase E
MPEREFCVPPIGLTSAEVVERVRRGQTNDFEARVGRTYWQIFRDNIFNLFNVILFTLLLIVLISRDYATVFFAGFSVVTNSFLGMIQEISAKRKLDQMASLAAQQARVWRDGQLQTIPIKQIVLDDVIELEPGDRIVVDGVVLNSDALEVDESQLTGESDAVLKNTGDPVSSGSFCIAGSGLMVATKVGRDSTLNKLSVIAKEYKNVLTPTQRKIAIIVEVSVLLMFIMGPMLFVSGFVQEVESLNLVRNGVVFVTSLVPQGLVLVAILSLTIGAVKISRHQTLIQRVNAVESLANVTVLCFDKTGTLTQNKLAVTEIIPLNGASPDQIHAQLYEYTTNLAYQNKTANAVASYVGQVKLRDKANRKLREIPFTSSRKWGALVFENETYILGAPERLIQDTVVTDQAQGLSALGMRVLAFAHTDELPESTEYHLNGNVQPIALIVMSDQIREDIQTTLDDFREQNVRLKVISGDNVETVRAIASGAGLPTQVAYTGDVLSRMSDVELENAVIEADVFARIEPETKRRIIQALQRKGEYVAMVGDGVNDVPALKAANLAIVMNDGTQISKDVADIVLLNNAMSTLPLAFREGREITQTIYGTTKMFLTKNVYNMLMFVFIGFMMLPFPITPVQISWAAFGTVNMPAGFIAFGIIRPKYIERFRRDVIDYIITAGLIGAVALSVLFAVAYFTTGGDLEIARSAITIFICLFGMMIVWNVQGVEVYKPRTFIEHWQVVLISSLAAGLTIISFYALPTLFEFQPPAPNSLLNVLIVALFLLTMMIINHGMEHRYLLNRFWMLVEREKS